MGEGQKTNELSGIRWKGKPIEEYSRETLILELISADMAGLREHQKVYADLLAACEAFLRAMSHQACGDTRNVGLLGAAVMAESAIAKARGGK